VVTPAQAQAGKVFELRTDTAPDGKLPLLQKRFRDHTLQSRNTRPEAANTPEPTSSTGTARRRAKR